MSLSSQYLCLPVGYEDSFEMFSLVQEDPVHYHMWHRLLTFAYRAHDRGTLRDEGGRRIGPQRFAQIYFRSGQKDYVERCIRFFTLCVDLGLLVVTPEELYRVTEWEAFLRKRVVLTTEQLAEQREKEREKKAKQRARRRAKKEPRQRPDSTKRCQEVAQQAKQVSPQCPPGVPDCPRATPPVPRQNENEKEIDLRSSSSIFPTVDLTARVAPGDEEDEDEVLIRDIKSKYPNPRGQPSNKRARTTQSFADVMRGAVDG